MRVDPPNLVLLAGVWGVGSEVKALPDMGYSDSIVLEVGDSSTSGAGISFQGNLSRSSELRWRSKLWWVGSESFCYLSEPALRELMAAGVGWGVSKYRPLCASVLAPRSR